MVYKWEDENDPRYEERRRQEWLKKNEGREVIECKEVENYF